jgi:hypothetical protein
MQIVPAPLAFGIFVRVPPGRYFAIPVSKFM